MNVVLIFDKSNQELTVSVRGDDSVPYSNTYKASNNPSSFNAPQGKTTYPKDGSKGQNYYPQKFPNGIWNVFTSRDGHNKFEGDNVLKTDAHQMVDVYKKDDDGNWVVDGQQDDSGYNIHDGDEEYADYTMPTDGCIRVEKATSKILKDLLDKIKTDGGSMKLIVKE